MAGLKLPHDEAYDAIESNHINEPEHTRPRRGSGFKNPEADYGVSDAAFGVDHINRHTGQLWPKLPKQGPDRPVRVSVERARASSADEYDGGVDEGWYGDPSRRQGG